MFEGRASRQHASASAHQSIRIPPGVVRHRAAAALLCGQARLRLVERQDLRFLPFRIASSRESGGNMATPGFHDAITGGSDEIPMKPQPLTLQNPLRQKKERHWSGKMRRRLKSFAVLVSAVFILAPNAICGIMPEVDLKLLCNQADLIAVGEVAGIRTDGLPTSIEISGQTIKAMPMAVELRVQDVLKGKLDTARLVFKWWLPPPSVYRGIGPGQFGVFFLRNAHDNYEILDLYHPFVSAGAPKTAGSCFDMVISELAFTIASNEATSRTKKDAFDALNSVQESSATDALKTAEQVGDASTRMLATASLLERGEMDRIGPAAAFPLSLDSDVDGYVAMRLRIAIEKTGTDPKAIPTLIRLLGAPDVRTRRTAAMALRVNRSEAAIGPLTGALEEDDREVQYQAVIGLAEITGTVGKWAPAHDTFLHDPQSHLDHWREWTRARKW